MIYAPDPKNWWSKYYGLMPTPDMVDEHRLRIYFAATDENRFGRIAYIEVDSKDPSKILYVSPEPVLDIGDLGTFDDCGVAPSCVINHGDRKLLYYVGFQRTVRVPYMLFTGLAVSDDGGRSFKRYSTTPILERLHNEYSIRSAPTILAENGLSKMWYVAGVSWEIINNDLFKEKSMPNYVIKYAESRDGIHWSCSEKICINWKSEDEFGFGRPWVIKEDNTYRMWYSIRRKSLPYRLGYAESTDGRNWTRKDEEVGIDVSDEGWDSEMICYPAVISANGVTYMFYNGNNNGETGLGYAELLE